MGKEKITLSVLTPRRKLFEKEVEMVVIKGTEGELGVMKGHIPLTVSLGYGLLKIKNEGEDLVAAVFGGFAEITPDKVTLLSDAAEWPDEIDIHRAEEAKLRAERRLQQSKDKVEAMRAELALRRALVRLETSSYKKN